MATLRARVPAYTEDRFFAPDIAAATALVEAGAFGVGRAVRYGDRTR